MQGRTTMSRPDSFVLQPKEGSFTIGGVKVTSYLIQFLAMDGMLRLTHQHIWWSTYH